MILMIKHKLTIYRKFELDIWGICKTSVRAQKIRYKTKIGELFSKVRKGIFKLFFKIWYRRMEYRELRSRRFVYRLDIKPEQRKRRKFNLRFLSIRLTRLYFLTLQDHHLEKCF